MIQLEYTKVREVKSPNRANEGDAGLDFYIPKLTRDELLKVIQNKDQFFQRLLQFRINSDEEEVVVLEPHGRVLIPSGIRVLINPMESMLMAANKSGVATKEGLVYTAEIVDSPYTGEMHMGIYNTNSERAYIELGKDKKLMQFIHIPIILSNPVEISNEEYEEKAKNWGTRGSKGFGAHDNK